MSFENLAFDWIDALLFPWAYSAANKSGFPIMSISSKGSAGA